MYIRPGVTIDGGATEGLVATVAGVNTAVVEGEDDVEAASNKVGVRTVEAVKGCDAEGLASNGELATGSVVCGTDAGVVAVDWVMSSTLQMFCGEC